ncbi:hypothetical protein KR054_000752 [Drosophila jambulina]|nr:hypothetical protein KR054_000752 [Drosophila jambulina]
MPEYVPAKGYKEMENLLKMHDKKNVPIYIYFYGEKDSEGRSWCIDCVEAEETIMTAFRENAPADCLILVVDVGDRAFWMNKENNFRKPPYSVDGIPALLHWKGVERLDGDQLRKANLLQLFFEETGTPKSAGTTTK